MLHFLTWGIGLAAWAGITAWGVVHLARYSFAPAHSGEPVESWPADTNLGPLARDAFTLVMPLHPECPCSRATLQQVDQLLAVHPRDLRVQLVFMEEGTRIEDSDLWNYAGRISGVSRFHDSDGAETRRFGFQTSGEARLYAQDGKLRFSGGLTVARGHAGESPGSRAVRAVLEGSGALPVTAPVFGCSLFNEIEPETKP